MSRKTTADTEAAARKNGCYMDVLERLKLGVGVRADFAVQVDLFVLRGNPFHEKCSLRGLNDGEEDSTIPLERNRENPLSLLGRRMTKQGTERQKGN
jgi:hypothetical protein